MSLRTYTVVGLWIDDEPVVAGVIEGEHPCVDNEPWDHGNGNLQRWATSVQAEDATEAEVNATAEMEES